MINFSTTDITQIQSHNLTTDTVSQQLEYFKTGFPHADIIAPTTLGNGIVELSDTARDKYIARYSEYKSQNHTIVKFVPASGAASRMFRDLFEFLDTGVLNKTTNTVLENLTKFAFYNDLKQYLPENATDEQIIRCLLTNAGINYGNLPKALLAFHEYECGPRTAIEEHLVEGAMYAATGGVSQIHFTISPEHRHGFDALLARVIPEYENKFGIKYAITMSVQRPSTDTIAVNPDNTPFRADNGNLLFRPAGHGALIENLNEIDADIIFIKNIDNICTEKYRPESDNYKMALAGMLIDIQNKVFTHLRSIDSSTADIDKVREFITSDLAIPVTDNATLDEMYKILNRPIRICGMIKSDGDTGGGPFWTRDATGNISRQIVETAQIAPDKRDVIKASTHFNSVDLVCGIRDYMGNKFDLTEFIDPSTAFITEKSAFGRPLRAMERPGLWNGAMAHWTSIFVQTPAITFNPVKTITDLLNTAHSGK